MTRSIICSAIIIAASFTMLGCQPKCGSMPDSINGVCCDSDSDTWCLQGNTCGPQNTCCFGSVCRDRYGNIVDTTAVTPSTGGSNSCSSASSPGGACYDITNQCETSYSAQSACYCAAACVCNACGEASCAASNASMARQLGLSCPY
jgi:hypothetical protein